MAIIPVLPGVEVTVRVDGRKLNEHPSPDAENDRRTVTRFIEAESEKIFEIAVQIKKGTVIRGQMLTFRFYIDGKCMSATSITRNHFIDRDYEYSSRGVMVAPSLEKQFRFSALDIANDDQKFHGEREKLKDLGTIRVDVDHEVRTGTAIQTYPEQAGATGVISEKAIKGRGLTHGLALTPPVRRVEGKCWNTRSVNPNKSPVAVFEFLYRSLESLKGMLIVPRTPTPPLPEERKLTSPTPEERTPTSPTPEQRTPSDLPQRGLNGSQQHAGVTGDTQCAQVGVKRERGAGNLCPRKRARPYAGDILFELDDDNRLRESSTADFEPAPREVVELD